jgi:hypothetical protein
MSRVDVGLSGDRYLGWRPLGLHDHPTTVVVFTNRTSISKTWHYDLTVGPQAGSTRTPPLWDLAQAEHTAQLSITVPPQAFSKPPRE